MPLNTTNLISTPGITGDIGQCQSNTAMINGATRTSFWIQQDVGKFVNSCTGQETTYQAWELTGDAKLLLWAGVIVAVILVITLGLKWLKNSQYN